MAAGTPAPPPPLTAQPTSHPPVQEEMPYLQLPLRRDARPRPRIRPYTGPPSRHRRLPLHLAASSAEPGPGPGPSAMPACRRLRGAVGRDPDTRMGARKVTPIADRLQKADFEAGVAMMIERARLMTWTRLGSDARCISISAAITCRQRVHARATAAPRL